ncbi:MAG: hypothetical protein KIT22_00430 [Verrucomicrobiae bacterium]|nr:hypothetical protein [Verrucomicrobiae bacterium]
MLTANQVPPATFGTIMIVEGVGSRFPHAGVVRVGAGGRLGGSGRVQGAIEVLTGGRVSPGFSPGALTGEGAYSQAVGGILEIELAGMKPASGHDVLRVTWAARLSGEWVLQFTEGLAPKAGQTFRIVQGDGGFQGSFETVTVAGLAPGFQYTLVLEGADALNLRAENGSIPITVPTLDIEIAPADAASVAVSWLANGTWILEKKACDGKALSVQTTERVGRR